MSTTVEFFGGPMDGAIKEIEEGTPYILIAKNEAVNLKESLPTAEIAIVRGRYDRAKRSDGRVFYKWAGWEDDLPKVQEDKGD